MLLNQQFAGFADSADLPIESLHIIHWKTMLEIRQILLEIRFKNEDDTQEKIKETP